MQVTCQRKPQGPEVGVSKLRSLARSVSNGYRPRAGTSSDERRRAESCSQCPLHRDVTVSDRQALGQQPAGPVARGSRSAVGLSGHSETRGGRGSAVIPAGGLQTTDRPAREVHTDPTARYREPGGHRAGPRGILPDRQASSSHHRPTAGASTPPVFVISCHV